MSYRALILRRLALSERNIAEHERRIGAQQVLLDRAIIEGFMVTAHTATLRRLTEALAVDLAARDRLRTELQALDENPRRELRNTEAHKARHA